MRSAWIEIDRWEEYEKEKQTSRSMRSAWIEIIMALTLRLARWSRSMRSAWIEMPGPVYIGAASVVALHAERVD